MACEAFDRELDALSAVHVDELLEQWVITWPALLEELERRELEP